MTLNKTQASQLVQGSIDTDNYIITSDSEAFITVAETAKLMGVPRTAMYNTVKRLSLLLTSVEVNGKQINTLDAKSLSLLASFYAGKTPEALKVLQAFAEAGAKAFIYHEAGYDLQAVKTPELLALEASVTALTNDVSKYKVLAHDAVQDRDVIRQDILASGSLVEVAPKKGFGSTSTCQSFFSSIFTKVGTKNALRDSACLLWIEQCDCVKIVDKYGRKEAVPYTAYRLDHVKTVVEGLINTKVRYESTNGKPLALCSSHLVDWDYTVRF